MLPDAMILVVDNASQDDTVNLALNAGARVVSEPRLGKGFAVRTGFAVANTDLVLLVDGDGTYDPGSAPAMIQASMDGADVVLGCRIRLDSARAPYRRGHVLGNRLLTGLSGWLIGFRGRDSLTGYRLMTDRFVRTFVGGASGFEIETELNAHALRLGLAASEIESGYSDRPEGSASKLRTYHDGARLARSLLRLFYNMRPLAFFVIAGMPWLIAATILGVYVAVGYLKTGLVLNFPSLIAGVGFAIVFAIFWLAGLITQQIATARSEALRLAFQNRPHHAS